MGFEEKIEEAFVKGIRDLARDILKDAAELAPARTRVLAESGHVREEDDGATVEFTASYAAKVNDALDGRRQLGYYTYTKDKRKGPHFLERARDEHIPEDFGKKAIEWLRQID